VENGLSFEIGSTHTDDRSAYLSKQASHALHVQWIDGFNNDLLGNFIELVSLTALFLDWLYSFSIT
jgi:hypothetical protein